MKFDWENAVPEPAAATPSFDWANAKPETSFDFGNAATEKTALGARIDRDVTSPVGERAGLLQSAMREPTWAEKAMAGISALKQGAAIGRAEDIAEVVRALRDPANAPLSTRLMVPKDEGERLKALADAERSLAAQEAVIGEESKFQQQIPQSSFEREFAARDLPGAIGLALTSPIALTRDVLVPSAIQFAPTMLQASLGGRGLAAVAGRGAEGATDAAIKAAQAIGQRVGQAGATAVTATGAGELEKNAEILQQLTSRGIDISDPKQLDSALKNQELMSEVVTAAERRAAIMGGAAGLSAGVAGLNFGRGATPLRRELTNVAAQTPLQAGIDVTGEALSQKAARGEVDWKDVALEGLAGIAAAPAEVGAAALGGYREQAAQRAEVPTEVQANQPERPVTPPLTLNETLQSLTDEDLRARSPKYDRLRASGLTEDQAKAEMIRPLDAATVEAVQEVSAEEPATAEPPAAQEPAQEAPQAAEAPARTTEQAERLADAYTKAGEAAMQAGDTAKADRYFATAERLVSRIQAAPKAVTQPEQAAPGAPRIDGGTNIQPVESTAIQPTETEPVTAVPIAERKAQQAGPMEFGEKKRKEFIATIKNLGGVNLDSATDITGERGRRAVRMSPGLFRRNAPNVDELATALYDEGYLTDADIQEVDGGAQKVRDLIQMALRGEPVMSMTDRDEYNALRAEDRAMAEEDATFAGLTEEGDVVDVALLERAQRLVGEDAFEDAATRFQDDDAGMLAWATETINAREQAAETGEGRAAQNQPEQTRAAGEPGIRAEAGRQARREDEGLTLTAQTEQSRQAEEAATRQAQQRQDQERTATENRAQADRERADFTLTGSNRPADVGMARGQPDLFTRKETQDATQERQQQQDRERERPQADARGPTAEAGGGNRAGQGRKAPEVNGEEPLASVTPTATRMAAVHNLTEDNLAFADRMGGIAVPSIGVVQPGQAIEGFGQITLIGTRDMADPERNPVFDADAYSPRFPKPSYDKVSTKVAQSVVDGFRDSSKKYDERSLIDLIWDNSTRNPNPQRIVEGMVRSRAAMGQFLKEQGINVEPVMEKAAQRAPFVDTQAFRDFEAKMQAQGIDIGNLSTNSPQWADYSKAVELAIDEFVASPAVTNDGTVPSADMQRILGDSYRRDYFEEGSLIFGRTQRIDSSIRNRGNMEVDTRATENKLNDAMAGKEADFKAWIDAKIQPMFKEPHLVLGRKKVPYTLENIVSAMTGRVRGQEETMTYGEGKARAMVAKRFKTMELMRSAAARKIRPESEVNAAREEAKKILEQYRMGVVNAYKMTNYRGEVDTWGALDASMKALTEGGKTKEKMRAALARNDFDVSELDDADIDLAITAFQAMIDAPVPYFEAKPQRAVAISEFAGAAIPRNSSPETRAILAKNGIEIEEYDGDNDRARAISALQERLADDVLFSAAPQGRAEQRRGKQPLTAASVRQIASRYFGEQGIDTLTSKGILQIVDSAEQLPPRLSNWLARREGGTFTVGGFYDRDSDKAYILSDRVNAGDVRSLILHEVGEHYGLERMMGREAYARLQKRVELIAKGNKTGPIGRAWADVKYNYVTPETNIKEGDDVFIREVIAKVGEDATVRKMSWWQEMLKAVREFLFRIGFPKSLNDADVQGLVMASLNHSMEPLSLSTYGTAAKGPIQADAARAQEDADFDQNEPSILASAKRTSPYHEHNLFIQNKDKSVWQKSRDWMQRQLTARGFLPQSAFDENRFRLQKLRVVDFDVRGAVAILERAIQKDYGKNADALGKTTLAELNEVLAGRGDPLKAPEQTRMALYAMRQYIDIQSMDYADIIERHIERGFEGADEKALATIRSNIGSYVHRSYKAFDDANHFSKLPDSVINDARAYLVEGYIEQGSSRTDAVKAANRVLEDMKAKAESKTLGDSMASFISEGKMGAKDLSVMIRRKQIAEPLRKYLGEYQDPRLNFAKTATKMGALIWNSNFLERVRDIGIGEFLFTEEDRPQGFNTQIAGLKSKTYAPLNGLYTTKEIAQAFSDTLNQDDFGQVMDFIIRTNGLIKMGKTVLSPTTAMRNFQSSLFFTLANGHFNMAKLADAAKLIRIADSDDKQKRAYVRKLVDYGVVGDGASAEEVMRLMRDARIDELLASKGGQMVRFARKSIEMAQGFYSFGDDFWKVVGFENNLQMLKKAGLDQKAAEKEAAERVIAMYPTYSMAGRLTRNLARFPVIASFPTFTAEIIRTSINLAKYTAKDVKSKNPVIRQMGRRRAVSMIMVAGMFHALQAATKWWFGIDDDEEEAHRILSAEWSTNSTFLFLGRDEKGNAQKVDLTFLDPYGWWKRPFTALMRDQPVEEAAVSALSDLLSPFMGLDIGFSVMMQFANNRKDSGAPVYNPNSSPMQKALDSGIFIADQLKPGFLNNAEGFVKAATDQVSPSRVYTVEDEIAALFGWRASTLDPRVSLKYRAYEFSDDRRFAKSGLNAVMRDLNDVSETEIEQAVDESIRQHNRAFANMHKVVMAATKAGMTDNDAYDLLKSSGVSRDAANAAVRGDVPPLELTRQAENNAVRSAESLRNPDLAKKIRERFKIADRLLSEKQP